MMSNGIHKEGLEIGSELCHLHIFCDLSLTDDRELITDACHI